MSCVILFQCLPVAMVIGQNCFGSVLYPVMTHMSPTCCPKLCMITWFCRLLQQPAPWQMLRTRYIASFLTTFVRKVGRTSDDIHKARFAACMSSKHLKVRACRDLVCKSHVLHCFIRCSVEQSRKEPSLIGGLAPMCLHLCIFRFFMCPGFGMEYDLFNQEITDFFVQQPFVCEGTWLVNVRW